MDFMGFVALGRRLSGFLIKGLFSKEHCLSLIGFTPGSVLGIDSGLEDKVISETE